MRNKTICYAGTELFGAEERKEINDVMGNGILFRYGHDTAQHKKITGKPKILNLRCGK